MPKKSFLVRAEGSAPLELAALLGILLLPLTPMLLLYSQIFDAIAAESIARHALRAAILSADGGSLDSAISEAVQTLSSSWQKEALFQYDCGRCGKGDLILLEIQVGNSIAIQVAGLEPK